MHLISFNYVQFSFKYASSERDHEGKKCNNEKCDSNANRFKTDFTFGNEKLCI